VPPSQFPKSEDWKRAVGAILSRLALHFHRPDFTEAQAKLLLADILSDLVAFSPAEINRACAEWRSSPANRFFPTSGQLIGLMRPYSEPRRRLATFKAVPEIEGPRATKSAAQILAEHAARKAKAP
jgi:hypothetical protein